MRLYAFVMELIANLTLSPREWDGREQRRKPTVVEWLMLICAASFSISLICFILAIYLNPEFRQWLTDISYARALRQVGR